MPQVLKEEIRENILQAALSEFFDHGYRSSTMRKIAEKAHIPTGLIYSYYPSKEVLLDAVLSPVLYDWNRILTTEDEKHRENLIYGLSKSEIDCLFQLFEHRQEFIILADKSEGTKYEQEKSIFIQAIEQHLSLHVSSQTIDSVFLHIIANNFVDGIMQIMYHYKGKEWAAMILQQLSKMYLSGIGY